MFSLFLSALTLYNHTHTVIKVDREDALKWSDDEVISRWTNLYSPSPIVECYLADIKLSKAEVDVVSEDVEKWRHRLYDMNIYPEAWLDSVKSYNKNYKTVIGTREGVKHFSQTIGRKWLCLSRISLQLYHLSPA